MWKKLFENRKRKRNFSTVLCIKGNRYFIPGTLYPMLGWNNGNHVFSIDELGNSYDMILHNYGDDLIDPETERTLFVPYKK